MKRSSVAVIAALVAFSFMAFVPVPADAADTATIKIINKSKWAIHHMYLSPNDVEEWGPDQLGEFVLEPGGSFTLTDIECDIWDIKVVDEDGDECEIRDVALCDESAVWKITDDELLSCEGWQ